MQEKTDVGRQWNRRRWWNSGIKMRKVSAALRFRSYAALRFRSSAVPQFRGSAAPREKKPSRTREEAFADVRRSLSGRRELRERHSGENSNAEPRDCGQEPSTAVSSQGVVEAGNGDAPATQGRGQKLSMQRNARSARKMSAVASDAAVGGYATSRHFQSTTFGPTKKNAGQLCHSRTAAFDDTSVRAIASFAF